MEYLARKVLSCPAVTEDPPKVITKSGVLSTIFLANLYL